METVYLIHLRAWNDSVRCEDVFGVAKTINSAKSKMLAAIETLTRSGYFRTDNGPSAESIANCKFSRDDISQLRPTFQHSSLQVEMKLSVKIMEIE